LENVLLLLTSRPALRVGGDVARAVGQCRVTVTGKCELRL